MFLRGDTVVYKEGIYETYNCVVSTYPLYPANDI